MKSLKRSWRRSKSAVRRPACACERWLIQVVKPVVKPPTTEPASAESAERYAPSIGSPENHRVTRRLRLSPGSKKSAPRALHFFTCCRPTDPSESRLARRRTRVPEHHKHGAPLPRSLVPIVSAHINRRQHTRALSEALHRGAIAPSTAAATRGHT